MVRISTSITHPPSSNAPAFVYVSSPSTLSTLLLSYHCIMGLYSIIVARSLLLSLSVCHICGLAVCLWFYMLLSLYSRLREEVYCSMYIFDSVS